MDQGRRSSLALVLLALVACKERPAPAPAQPPPPADAALLDEALRSKALEKKVALYGLRSEIKIEAESSAPWPTDEVHDLDFRRTGNAIIAYRETGLPFVTASKARPFELLPLVDDPWNAVTYVREHADVKLAPALEQMVRAKYVLFVMGNQDQPMMLGSSYTPAKLSATGLLYEIESKKLLGGLSFRATNTEGLTLKRDNDAANYDTLMSDFETNARTALWTSVKARFSSA
ncbi:MAG: hypothetical protein M4D80_42525, partial [Myxococcota bacterium]|nr:hypothetical protein [Myxococcota bacterium]